MALWIHFSIVHMEFCVPNSNVEIRVRDGLILSLDIGQEEENCYWCVSRLTGSSPGSIHKPFDYMRYISVHVCLL